MHLLASRRHIGLQPIYRVFRGEGGYFRDPSDGEIGRAIQSPSCTAIRSSTALSSMRQTLIR